jgi:hypothetical protein
MPKAFRVTASDGRLIGDVDTLDEALRLVEGARPGRYRVGNAYRDPGTRDPRWWDWGEIAKDHQGRIRLHCPPWTD